MSSRTEAHNPHDLYNIKEIKNGEQFKIEVVKMLRDATKDSPRQKVGLVDRLIEKYLHTDMPAGRYQNEFADYNASTNTGKAIFAVSPDALQAIPPHLRPILLYTCDEDPSDMFIGIQRREEHAVYSYGEIGFVKGANALSLRNVGNDVKILQVINDKPVPILSSNANARLQLAEEAVVFTREQLANFLDLRKAR